MTFEFVECETCNAKPGSPTLCIGCLNNRSLIDSLSAKLDSAWADCGAWEAAANSHRDEAARLQLVAGRYQFMWEAAQLCLNKIDDWFEYAVMKCSPYDAQNHVQKHLKIYTEAVSKSRAQQIGK